MAKSGTEPPMRLGVFGGTFDPIHQTHLDAAAAALRQAQLDRVLFVVAANPPHKRDEVLTPAADRAAMVAAALEAYPEFECSTLELARSGPSYTVDTLRDLKAQYPAAELFLIIGGDALVDLPRWREPDVILQLARILVVPRPGFTPEIPPALAGHTDILDFSASRRSSTTIREQLELGASTDSDVPPAALEVIRARGLYARS